MADNTSDRESLISLTSDIVIAHLGNNNVAVAEVPELISSVFDVLSGLGAEPLVGNEPLEPAVSIRSSVKPDRVACLECGKQMKTLKRHLATYHGLSIDDYRQRWGLSITHPLVAPNYAAKRADLAKKIGLGRGGRGGRGGRKSTASGSASQPTAPEVAEANTRPAVAGDALPSKRRKLIQRLKEAGDTRATEPMMSAPPLAKADAKKAN